MKKFVLSVVFISAMLFACTKESDSIDPSDITTGTEQDVKTTSSGNDTTTVVPPSPPTPDIPGIPSEPADTTSQSVPPAPPVPVDPAPLPVDSDSLKNNLSIK